MNVSSGIPAKAIRHINIIDLAMMCLHFIALIHGRVVVIFQQIELRRAENLMY